MSVSHSSKLLDSTSDHTTSFRSSGKSTVLHPSNLVSSFISTLEGTSSTKTPSETALTRSDLSLTEHSTVSSVKDDITSSTTIDSDTSSEEQQQTSLVSNTDSKTAPTDTSSLPAGSTLSSSTDPTSNSFSTANTVTTNPENTVQTTSIDFNGTTDTSEDDTPSIGEPTLVSTVQTTTTFGSVTNIIPNRSDVVSSGEAQINTLPTGSVISSELNGSTGIPSTASGSEQDGSSTSESQTDLTTMISTSSSPNLGNNDSVTSSTDLLSPTPTHTNESEKSESTTVSESTVSSLPPAERSSSNLDDWTSTDTNPIMSVAVASTKTNPVDESTSQDFNSSTNTPTITNIQSSSTGTIRDSQSSSEHNWMSTIVMDGSTTAIYGSGSSTTAVISYSEGEGVTLSINLKMTIFSIILFFL
ncbi:hypothetical protein WICANDRAFT_98149 [Wickerhamomyces anomalus NRRL Y-366-8]|uniref:Uncharacterized protein n=1 Tax=Wickerhamomyces anomalus (strain ATCC 58044 / CBS 1984 / NCYC 433 / NRRL Y-366-8) TaxID=683960 RepID=A0A1E3NWF8_WICAA|nr:uncharacterized protein WICANDRAFT_98149 [Wickerhamomyces anomalus NRRL Y-366-8]ODQ56907.1 hypothetical protein WICANDRAFT_98149 [Wickerhamomyces anomalus NRRL Y-366-8]